MNYGGDWPAIRKAYLRDNPACAECGAPAKHIDHIKDLRDGGTHARENLQSLCVSCHSRKTLSKMSKKPTRRVLPDGSVIDERETTGDPLFREMRSVGSAGAYGVQSLQVLGGKRGWGVHKSRVHYGDADGR